MIAAGKTIGQVSQALEVSEQTFHRWREIKNQIRNQLRFWLLTPFLNQNPRDFFRHNSGVQSLQDGIVETSDETEASSAGMQLAKG